MARLTDLAVKNAKPKAAKYTLSAGQGLTLLVMPDGAKYWRLRYRFGGKRRWLEVGDPYPATKLKDAQANADRCRALLRQGIDPSEQKRAEILAQRKMVERTFGSAADSWHEFRSRAWNQKTALQVREYLDKDVLPKLRVRPLDSVSPAELGALVAGIEKRGAYDVAKKTRQ